MKTRELFLKDPLSWRIANDGVSSNNVEDLDTLRYELETFVCQGEYQSGLAKILQGYLDNLGKEQRAAWVSGFYGSGKSHLVKVLRYLWTDYPLHGGVTARTLATLPEDIRDLLVELSTRGKQGVGLHSAGGTMKAGVGSVRLRLLGIVLLSVGLPEKLSFARLLMDLRDDGKLDGLRGHIADTDKDPSGELSRFYTSRATQEAYLAAYPHLGDIANVSAALRAQYPPKVDEISIDDMLAVVRRALSREGQLPCTLVVLDEVQQFINSSPDIAHDVQEVVEALSKELDGRVLVVGTGQSALTDTPALQRLMGRFTMKVHLKDNDVEKVVRTVVLQKKEQAKGAIHDQVSKHSGEISRQLKATRIATRADDDASYVPDYPLLPVRRRFWEQVLHSCDPSGTAAQMRTQLRVTHEACCLVADRPLGAIIPADFIYDQQANELVISGEMQKPKVTNATLVKIPFDLAHWQQIAAEKYPNGLPKPHSDDPTQWLFNGHPKGSEQPLQVAVARLLGYRWPRQTGSEFPDCPALGPDGLEDLADADGIVCLPPINKEQPAAARLRNLLAAAWSGGVSPPEPVSGQDGPAPWSPSLERDLLAATGAKQTNLDDWLRDAFFEQHCKLFKNRPFIWHLWDGRKDGFHALVSYHRLDYATLQKLTYSYLGDWIRQQDADAKADKPGAAERLGAAQALEAELIKILEGEPPSDIFVRWKPIQEQPLGWQPDLNDGVRLSIRPFMLARDLGKKGAGILRAKPNIKWDKDRGKEPHRDKADHPWFWHAEEPPLACPGGPDFTGNRWNNVHLTLARKRAARATVRQEGSQ